MVVMHVPFRLCKCHSVLDLRGSLTNIESPRKQNTGNPRGTRASLIEFAGLSGSELAKTICHQFVLKAK